VGDSVPLQTTPCSASVTDCVTDWIDPVNARSNRLAVSRCCAAVTWAYRAVVVLLPATEAANVHESDFTAEAMAAGRLIMCPAHGCHLLLGAALTRHRSLP
jgi:hypothetical protein